MSAKPPKPVVVRVKRKQFQEPLDALWLEISERPLKRALLDFSRLSISESTGDGSVSTAKNKIFLQRIKTVSSSNVTKDVLESFLFESADKEAFNKKIISERRSMHKQDGVKRGHLRSTAMQDHEGSARNARFEQIWKSRKTSGQQNDRMLHEVCHLYDLVRLDYESKTYYEDKGTRYSNTDANEVSKFLPLMKEFLPEVAEEIKSDLKRDNYVYDIYTIETDVNMSNEDSSSEYPLVQVDDANDYDDYNDGHYESEYDSEDSNAENSNLYDYPDEESSVDDEESSVDDEESSVDDEESSADNENSSVDNEKTVMTEECEIEQDGWRDSSCDESEHFWGNCEDELSDTTEKDIINLTWRYQ